MTPMTPEETRAFLLQGTRTGNLATVRADGRPHVAPIWFTLDGNDLVFSTGRDSVKGQNMARDPRVMLSVDDETPPFAFVLVEGTAVIAAPSVEELRPWTTRIARRYMGDAQAHAYGRRNAGDDELLVRVPMTKVNAQKGIADW
jgi:PPOX class probable F420-dependent enzyme